MDKIKKDDYKENIEEIDNFCEECKKEDKVVSQNLILTGFKICHLANYLKLFIQFNLLC